MLLAQNTSLKTLEITFSRFKPNEIKHDDNHFPQQANTSIETLAFRFNSSGKANMICNAKWLNFIGMFGGVRDLTISSCDISLDKEFLGKIVNSMPLLRKFAVEKCVIKPEGLENFTGFLGNESCQLEDLSIDCHQIPAVKIGKILIALFS